jgi:hypothetical protein
MRLSISLAFLMGVAAAFGTGCGAVEDQPSYADLVVIYTAELESLDRLEQKKAKKIAGYEKTLQPNADAALAALTGVLGSAVAANRDASAELPSDPNELLDRAAADAAKMQQSTTDLLDAVAKQAEAQAGDGGSLELLYSDEFKAELAAIDAEIAEQQQRVDRARAARDKAEAK